MFNIRLPNFNNPVKKDVELQYLADWYAELEEYLEPRGLEPDLFSASIRTFFEASRDHYKRLAYRNAAADWLRLDMKSESDCEKLWKLVGRECGISEKVIAQWVSGEHDPPTDVLERYLIKSQCPDIESKIPMMLNVIGATQMGISRTIVYIFVFPPTEADPEKLADGRPIGAKLKKCWNSLKQHRHYHLPQAKPRKNLNQHALDIALGHFREGYFDVENVGELMHQIMNRLDRDHPLFYEFSIFKYATLVRIPSGKIRKTNPYLWLWDDTHPRFSKIWGTTNV